MMLAVGSVFTTVARADYSLRLVDGNVSVSISADFVQGVPSISSNETRVFGDIPTFNVGLEGGNSSLFVAALNNSIRTKSPSATARDLTFHASSNGTWMHYQLDFIVEGVSGAGNEKVDLAWRSFVISEDVKAGDYSINNLLPTYLAADITLLAEARGGLPIQQQRLWYLNNLPRTAKQIPFEIHNLLMFNFTTLNQPLDQWTITRNIEGPVTRLQSTTGFNLTFIGRLSDPTGTFTLARNAVYNVEAIVEAPGLSAVSGDVIIFDGEGAAFTTQLMLALVLLTGSLFLGTTVMDRRLRQTPSGRRTKRSNR